VPAALRRRAARRAEREEEGWRSTHAPGCASRALTPQRRSPDLDGAGWAFKTSPQRLLPVGCRQPSAGRTPDLRLKRSVLFGTCTLETASQLRIWLVRPTGTACSTSCTRPTATCRFEELGQRRNGEMDESSDSLASRLQRSSLNDATKSANSTSSTLPAWYIDAQRRQGCATGERPQRYMRYSPPLCGRQSSGMIALSAASDSEDETSAAEDDSDVEDKGKRKAVGGSLISKSAGRRVGAGAYPNRAGLQGITKPQREKRPSPARPRQRKWRRSEAAEASYGCKTWSDIVRYLAIKARENEVTLESFLASSLECVSMTSTALPGPSTTTEQRTSFEAMPPTQLLMSCSL
jgi:hypothetical protein